MRSKIAVLGICIILSGTILSIWVDTVEIQGQVSVNPDDIYYINWIIPGVIIQPVANVTINIEADQPVYSSICNISGLSYFRSHEEANVSLIVLATEILPIASITSQTYYGDSLRFEFEMQDERYVLIILNDYNSPNNVHYSTQIKWRPLAPYGIFLSVVGVLITFIMLLQSGKQKLEILHIKQPFSRNHAEQ